MRIGYLWQYNSADLSRLSATVLHVKAVIDGLQKLGHHVQMVTFSNGFHSWSRDMVSWNRIELMLEESSVFLMLESLLRGIQSRLSLPYFNFFESLRFAEACTSSLTDCHILYERYWLNSFGGLMASRKLGIPLVLEVNGDLVSEYAQLGIRLSKSQWAAIHLINRCLFMGATHVITVSEPLKRLTAKRWKIDASKISVVPNGANIDLFSQANKSSALKQKYRLNGSPVVIFVGAFMPWHNVDLLIDAFNIVYHSHKTAQLLLVGDGPTRLEVEKKVKSLRLDKRVVFTGKVSHQDVAALLGTAEMAVMSHRLTESGMVGSPLKLFEYMAAGKAIVATKLPNFERILTNYETGLLVSPDNALTLAKAILELHENPELRRKLGENAKTLADREYSWDSTVSRLERVFSSLVRIESLQPLNP